MNTDIPGAAPVGVPSESLFDSEPTTVTPNTIGVGNVLVEISRRSPQQWNVLFKNSETQAPLCGDKLDLTRATSREKLIKRLCKEMGLEGEEKATLSQQMEQVLLLKSLEPMAKPKEEPNGPIKHADGRLVACQHNSRLWLAARGMAEKICYDQFLRQVFVDGIPIDGEMLVDWREQIESAVGVAWNKDDIRDAIVNLSHDRQFSSLTNWLGGLIWDGTPRIDMFFPSAYGAEDTPYHRECARVLFLSAVARAFQPGCQVDTMPVLIGPQGIGKSMGMASLCPWRNWYAQDIGGDLFDRKSTGECLQGKWLIEFPELYRLNGATGDTIKAFITRQYDRYRPSYGYTAKDFARTCIFLGTTNNEKPLRDDENRRYLPVRCVQGNIPLIEEHRDQLWAEAIKRYRDGEKWWTVDPSLLAACKEQQEEAREEDPWEPSLAGKLAGMTQVFTDTVARSQLGIKTEEYSKATQMRIATVLKKIGFVRGKQIRINGIRQWPYVRPLNT